MLKWFALMMLICLPAGAMAAGAPATRPAAWYQLLGKDRSPQAALLADDGYAKVTEEERAVYEELDGVNWFRASRIEREKAFLVLLYACEFRWGPAAGGAVPPTEAGAFCNLLLEPDAAEAFAELVRRGRGSGQMYGLCGLYLCDRARFDKLSVAYVDRHQEVVSKAGCIGTRRPMSGIVDSLSNGRIPRTLLISGRFEEVKELRSADQKPAPDTR